jgi:hypothetical protein
MKYKCMVCQPACLLELRGFKSTDVLPSGCTFPENKFRPVWERIGAKKASRTAAKKKSAKKSEATVQKENDKILKSLLF